MNIEAKGFKIELDLDELWEIAFAVKGSVTNTLKTHWIHHQDVWEKNESKKLKLLKTMFSSLGRLDVYESIFTDADKIFKEYNEKNKS